MPADKLFAYTLTGLTVFGERAECGAVFPAPDWATAVEAVSQAHQSGRLEPLTPGKYPEMSVVICVFEVPLTPAVVAAVVAHRRGSDGR